jgi:hypothetical protein
MVTIVSATMPPTTTPHALPPRNAGPSTSRMRSPACAAAEVPSAIPRVSRFGTANNAARATNAPRSCQDRLGSTACARNRTGTAVKTAPTTMPHQAPAENEPSTALPITCAHHRGRNDERKR